MKQGWEELNQGSDIKIPKIFYYVIKYVTPAYLIFIMLFWTIDNAIPTLLLEGVKQADVAYRWGARAFMLVMLLACMGMVWLAWKRNKGKAYHEEQISEVN
jgi:SNF family Na+-dependent transporter